MDNAIYIVFSATPIGMGSVIRFATGHRYNHVSLSLSRDIHKMYSFARLYRAIPLYGGFVAESILRYQSFAGTARVKICRVEVPELQFTYLRNDLERLWNEREEYIYNTPAACADWGEDAYPVETTTRYAVYTTARHFGRLALRVLTGAA